MTVRIRKEANGQMHLLYNGSIINFNKMYFTNGNAMNSIRINMRHLL